MSLARAASAFIERRPNATTVAAAMARGAAGDACAQRAEDHGTWDARRCATFMAWSTGVAFALDRYVYSHLFARWWPPVWKSNLRHVRDACSIAWRCRFLTRRKPDTLVDFHTGGRGPASATC